MSTHSLTVAPLRERVSSQSGVTLLELLIAITLVTLVSVGILTAMRVGFIAMDRTNTKLMGNRRVIGAQRILEQQLAGFLPATADCISAPNQAPSPIKFFQGEPESMRFVTTYSIQEASRGVPQIVEYQIIPGDDGKGVRLVVNERPYTGPRAAGVTCLGILPHPVLNVPAPRFRPVEVGPASFVLADKLAFCRFAYREKPNPPQPEKWLPMWVSQFEWPSAVRVDMAPLGTDSSRLQLLPVTVPIRATKDPLVTYENVY